MATAQLTGTSVEAARVEIAGTRVWGMLVFRSLLAIALQAAAAAIALIAGAADPWRVAADWWLAWFVVLNVVTLVVLQRLLAMEGRRLRDLYRIDRVHLRGDLGWLLVVLVVAGPLGMLPNMVLGQALWGSSQVGADLSFRALPVAAALAILVTFPIVQGAAELPTYFGYVLPRLRERYGWQLRAVLVTAFVLSTQHVFLPTLFDWRFIAWRGLMFLPFALWFGFALDRRPRLLPFLVVAHGLLDASLPILVLVAST